MKRTLLLLFTCLMLLSWPQRAMAELQTAVFAGGCFWCLEHDLETLPVLLRPSAATAVGMWRIPPIAR